MANAINKRTSLSLLGKYAEGVGLLVGMIFGAGVFALPYAFAKAGLAWGIVFFIFALFVVIVSHILYGEIVFFLKDGKRFTGYVELLIGKKAKALAFLVTIFSSSFPSSVQRANRTWPDCLRGWRTMRPGK